MCSLIFGGLTFVTARLLQLRSTLGFCFVSLVVWLLVLFLRLEFSGAKKTTVSGSTTVFGSIWFNQKYISICSWYFVHFILQTKDTQSTHQGHKLFKSLFQWQKHTNSWLLFFFFLKKNVLFHQVLGGKENICNMNSDAKSIITATVLFCGLHCCEAYVRAVLSLFAGKQN